MSAAAFIIDPQFAPEKAAATEFGYMDVPAKQAVFGNANVLSLAFRETGVFRADYEGVRLRSFSCKSLVID